MGKFKGFLVALTALFSAALLVVGNLFFAPRDASITVSIPSFEATQIVENRLWTEGPVQVLHSFMGAGTIIVAVGVPGQGGLPFADRLKLTFGEENVDQSQNPIDLREALSDEDLRQLDSFVQRLSYRSLQPCPHDLNQECIIAVGWNRDRTKEAGMRMIATRVSENTYLLLDDSVLVLGGS